MGLAVSEGDGDDCRECHDSKEYVVNNLEVSGVITKAPREYVEVEGDTEIQADLRFATPDPSAHFLGFGSPLDQSAQVEQLHVHAAGTDGPSGASGTPCGRSEPSCNHAFHDDNFLTAHAEMGIKVITGEVGIVAGTTEEGKIEGRDTYAIIEGTDRLRDGIEDMGDESVVSVNGDSGGLGASSYPSQILSGRSASGTPVNTTQIDIVQDAHAAGEVAVAVSGSIFNDDVRRGANSMSAHSHQGEAAENNNLGKHDDLEDPTSLVRCDDCAEAAHPVETAAEARISDPHVEHTDTVTGGSYGGAGINTGGRGLDLKFLTGSADAGDGGSSSGRHFKPVGLVQDPVGQGGVYPQALHTLLAIAVFALVTLTKPSCVGDSDDSEGASGHDNHRGRNARPDERQSSSSARQTGAGTGVGSVAGQHRQHPHQQQHKRKRRSQRRHTSHVKSGEGGLHACWTRAWRGLRASARRLVNYCSRLWHKAEAALGSRWRLAGKFLRLLRKSWGTLSLRSLPSPHPEADTLATAVATMGTFSSSNNSRDEALSRARSRTGQEEGGDKIGRAPAGGTGGAAGGRDVRSRQSNNSGLVGGGSGPTWGGGDLRRLVPLSDSFLKLCGYRPLGDGGGSLRSRAPKYLLVLDLDETLVHCSQHYRPPYHEIQRGGVGGRGERQGSSVCPPPPDIKLEMRGSGASGRPACMYAWKRPHLDVFLRVVSRWYEIAVFTSGRQCFAKVRFRGKWEGGVCVCMPQASLSTCGITDKI
ncbi:unnamed protein product [Choristocarpus tenellus]